jgi:serine/threonine protein kinase
MQIFEMTPKKRERCLQEVVLLQQLTHPNIIQMLDAFIDENQLIIVFEWAPAGDLKRLIKKTAESGRCFDESAIWDYFFQVCTSLSSIIASIASNTTECIAREWAVDKHQKL